MAKRLAKVWFDTGLNFACTSCGKCCTSKTTNVYINPAEMQALAKHLDMHLFDFVREYTEDREGREGDNQLLTSVRNKAGACALLSADRRTCSVHPVKPMQCRTYPYWTGNLIGEAEWKAEASRCEGIVLSSEHTRVPVPVTATRDEIAKRLILQQVHARGTGENWTYDEAEELLAETFKDTEHIDEFIQEFAGTYSSTILHESDSIRVVDATAPHDDVDDTSEQKKEFDEGLQQASVLAPSPPLLSRLRRLEFISSPHLAQTEMLLQPCESDGDDNAVLDHTRLVMPVHRAMAMLVLLAAPFCGEPSARTFNVAVIGAGGCALPSFLASHPSFCGDTGRHAKISAVEPDGEVLRAAEKFFGCRFKGRATGTTAASNARDDSRAIIVKSESTGESFLRTLAVKHENATAAATSSPSLFDVILLDTCTPSGDDEGVVLAPSPGMLSAQVLSDLATCLSEEGFVAINTLGGQARADEVSTAFRGLKGGHFAEPVKLEVEGCSNVLLLLTKAGGENEGAGRARVVSMAGLMKLALAGEGGRGHLN